MRRLTAFDAQFLAIETGNMTCHYCGLGVFDPSPEGPLSVERVRAHVAGRIHRIPPLRWHLRTVPLGFEHPSWVDGPVDVTDHVRGITLPAPGGPRELADVAAEIMATRLDRSRPLWELQVIDGLEDGRVAVGLTFHHAVADALTASAIMSLLMDVEPDGRTDWPDTEPPRVIGPVRALLRDGLSIASQPLSVARAMNRALPHLDQVPMMRTLPGARTMASSVREAKRALGSDVIDPGAFAAAPRTRFNGPLSARRSIAFDTVPVATIRALKSHHGVTFNDIVVAAVAGGLRRRLAETGELPDDPLLAFVPVNVRSTEGDASDGNLITSFVVPLPTTRGEGDERISAAHEAMRVAKERGGAVPETLVRDANAMIPPVAFRLMASGMLGLMGAGRVAPPLNLTISNIPGPPSRLHLAGAPMVSVAPLSLVFDGAGLNVTVVSYAGDLQIGVVGDGEAVPDAWEMLGAIVAEFEALAALIPVSAA